MNPEVLQEKTESTEKTSPLPPFPPVHIPDTNGNSTLAGVSIRGWLAVLTILTVCAMALLTIEVQEPLYTLAVAIVAFYYGQNTKKGT